MTHSRDLFRIVSEQGVVNYGNLPKSATSTVIVIGAPKSVIIYVIVIKYPDVYNYSKIIDIVGKVNFDQLIPRPGR